MAIAHALRGAVPFPNGGELAVVYSFVFLYFAVALVVAAQRR
jgi:hypothetical protein